MTVTSSKIEKKDNCIGQKEKQDENKKNKHTQQEMRQKKRKKNSQTERHKRAIFW